MVGLCNISTFDQYMFILPTFLFIYENVPTNVK
jgi:hypothetical protein